MSWPLHCQIRAEPIHQRKELHKVYLYCDTCNYCDTCDWGTYTMLSITPSICNIHTYMIDWSCRGSINAYNN